MNAEKMATGEAGDADKALLADPVSGQTSRRRLAIAGAILLHAMLPATAINSRPRNQLATEPRVIEINLSAPAHSKAALPPRKTENSGKGGGLKRAKEPALHKGKKPEQPVQRQTPERNRNSQPNSVSPAAPAQEKERQTPSSRPTTAAMPTSPADSRPDDTGDTATPPLPPLEKAAPRYHANPPPEYPPLARKRGLEGTVELDVLVNRLGAAEQIKLARSSSHDLLDRAAIAAVSRWLFLPGKQGAEDIPMWVRIPIRYALQEK